MARKMPPRWKSGPLKGKFRSKKSVKAARAAQKGRRKKKAAPKKRRRKVAKKKRRRRRSKRTSALMNRAKVLGWTAVYAYMKEQSDYGQAMVQKIPHVSAIGYDATMMLAAHYLAKHGPSFAKKPLDALATGLAGKVGYDFGANKFQVKGMAGGVLGGGSIGGELVPDDFDETED